MVKYMHEEDRVGYAEGKASGKKPMNDYGCMDYKGEAMDQAFGQAGMRGVKEDQRKINAQMFSGAYRDDSSGV